MVIIGIVAAMTIPTLHAKYEEKILTTQLKETYALLSNSYQMTIKEDGLPFEWGMEKNANWSPEAGELMVRQFTKHLKVRKYCFGKGGCFPKGNYKSINGKMTSRNEYANQDSAMLENGASIGVATNSTKCEINDWGRDIPNMCGQIKIDVNGAKGPNVMGKDYFVFYVLSTGIVPIDFSKDMQLNGCGDTGGGSFGSLDYNGWGCTAWALYKGNFEYTKCSPGKLSWQNDKCK